MLDHCFGKQGAGGDDVGFELDVLIHPLEELDSGWVKPMVCYFMIERKCPVDAAQFVVDEDMRHSVAAERAASLFQGDFAHNDPARGRVHPEVLFCQDADIPFLGYVPFD